MSWRHKSGCRFVCTIHQCRSAGFPDDTLLVAFCRILWKRNVIKLHRWGVFILTAMYNKGEDCSQSIRYKQAMMSLFKQLEEGEQR